MKRPSCGRSGPFVFQQRNFNEEFIPMNSNQLPLDCQLFIALPTIGGEGSIHLNASTIVAVAPVDRRYAKVRTSCGADWYVGISAEAVMAAMGGAA
jgi:hypothetical protein